MFISYASHLLSKIGAGLRHDFVKEQKQAQRL